MEQGIKIFESPQFGQIRTAGTPDEPLFCAIDVCNALGYSNNRDALARHVDENDVVKHDAIDNLGRKQSTAFVNESGLYTLIFGSNLKAAKEFKHWVTSEVLPTIRNAENNVENEQIQIFENPQFGIIRTAGTSENPMFCLADICKVLELQVTPTKNRLKADGVNSIKVIDAMGRSQNATFVNEQNLYYVIMRSDKPQARAFQDWVCGDVLPTIRNAEHDAENGQIQIFENPQFGTIRTAGTNEEPLFCLVDIAKALEYSNPAKAVIDHCKGVTVLETPTRNQYGAIVIQQIKYGKESEVYRLIMKSKTPKAEAFQDWVCGDVLPTIRKTGKYEIAKPNETPAAVAEMQTKIDRLQSTVDDLVLLVRELKAQKPKALGNSRLIFGIFQPGEQIQMSDKRLYEGNGSPFRNYQQMARAKRKGCPFRTPDTIRQWSIKAEELEYWLTSNPRPMR